MGLRAAALITTLYLVAGLGKSQDQGGEVPSMDLLYSCGPEGPDALFCYAETECCTSPDGSDNENQYRCESIGVVSGTSCSADSIPGLFTGNANQPVYNRFCPCDLLNLQCKISSGSQFGTCQ